jgi:hypothetical protein
MKRAAAFALSACLLLALCACGAKSETKTEQKPVYDDSLITETYAEDGSYTDETGYAEDYSYHVPSLSADSDGAQTINSAIADRFGKAVEENKGNMKEKISLNMHAISWKTYWHDSVVCLVVEADYDADDYIDYGVYNYDFASGKAVTNTELFSMAGMTEDEFLKNVRAAVSDRFESFNKDLKGDISDAEYQQLRDDTLSDENVNADMGAYIDGDGNLTVVTKIGVPAGGGWVYDKVVVSKT